MNASGMIRGTPVRATRRLLAALVVLWLNMVLQPCAMGADAEHDCPHCPPAHHEQSAGHHGHGAREQAAPCATFEAQCSDIGDISLESRNGGQASDVEQPDCFAVESISRHHAVTSRVSSPATGPPSCQQAARPIYILNCAYLK